MKNSNLHNNDIAILDDSNKYKQTISELTKCIIVCLTKKEVLMLLT